MSKALIGITLGTLALGAITFLPSIADAYRGDPSINGPYYSEERHQAMEKAFETNDYNSWKNLMDGRGRVTEVITEENFSKFAQAHKLAEEGNFDEARKIRQELGLSMGPGMRYGNHR